MTCGIDLAKPLGIVLAYIILMKKLIKFPYLTANEIHSYKMSLSMTY